MRGTLVFVLLTSISLAGQALDDTSERQLQAAIHKEEIVGDLRGAIELYKSLSAARSGNRSVAAVALLRVGDCQEKLGQTDAAKKAYERVVLQFSDVPDVRMAASARIQEITPQRTHDAPLGFGVATATFPLAAAKGKHIRYSGYIRTENVTGGWAGLWWRVDGEPGTGALAFDTMSDRGAKGTTPWTLYVIDLDVPANARNINFGVLHVGTGTAWFDTLKVEIDGAPFTDNYFDFDFESTSPRGFYTGGKGYKVELDKEVAHTGRQSLRSRQMGPEPAHATRQ